MIVDCFTYFNESVLLIARLDYLYTFCDLFVVCEANKTHQGKDKPFNAKSIVKKLRPEYYHKCRFVECHDLPVAHGDAANWERERYQRNAIMRSLYDLPLDAHIIISDIDEFPNAESLLPFVKKNSNGIKPTALQMSMYMYSAELQLQFNGVPVNWEQGRICSLKYLASPQWLRKCKVEHTLINGGWHLTYMGGVKAIHTKINAFSHSEFNNSYYLDNLEENINSRIDPYARPGYSLKNVSIASIPKIILQTDKSYFFPNICY